MAELVTLLFIKNELLGYGMQFQVLTEYGPPPQKKKDI